MLFRSETYSTLLSRSELQVLWLEPGTVDDLDDDAWNKSRLGALGEQRVSLSVPEELDEPEPSRDPNEPRRHR